MTVDIPLTLAYLRPGEEWTLDGDAYKGLTWMSSTAKPTEAEVMAAYPLAQAAADKAVADRSSALRKMAATSGLTPDELAALGL